MKPINIAKQGPVSAHVCVIGGGGTGAALAYDLALRGCRVTLLERGELTSGTTGRHHGQLHSGARYAPADPAIARECYEETLILRRIAPETIEYNGGYFVALNEEEADFGPRFIEACRAAGIPAKEIPPENARRAEPALSPSCLRAVWVPDGSFDAFRLPLSFFAAARRLGAEIRPWNEVLGLERGSGRITAARILDRTEGGKGEYRLEADYFLNAAGAWAGKLGALAGIDVPISPAPGTMVAVKGRLCDRVLSRLRPAQDGDILVPQRGLTIIGSTQHVTENPESLIPPTDDIEALRAWGAEIAPAFNEAPIHAAWCAARPLAGRADNEAAGRAISRDFAVLDHEERDGVSGIATVVGGKATVLRAMAEKAANLAASKLGIDRPCATKDRVLPSWREYYGGKGW